MMRSSNSKAQGKVEAVNSESPLENGLPPKEEEDDMGQNVRELAAKVVDDVVKMASEAAQQRTSTHSPPTKNRGCNLQRLPTIQIDTVPSAPPSPVDLTPPEELDEIEEALDESEIQLDLDTTEQDSENTSDDLKDFLKSYVEDILSQAMVLAEKKLQFAGLPDEDEQDEPEPEPESVEPSPEPAREPEKEIVDESEVRATAEKVVQEVIEKASETAAEKLENSLAELNFPIKFDDAPDDVKEAATSFVKEIVGKAVAMAEEKSVPTVPFNFEDVDLMKTSGPWYVRAREALIRLLRTACFCTPRRTDS